MDSRSFVYRVDAQGRYFKELGPQPPVAAARPPRCPGCQGLAVDGGRINLHGHGVRTRSVVVLWRDEQGLRLIQATCWSRRFLCRLCRRSCVVLPPGVLAGHLYSLLAIAAAWWATSSMLRAGGEQPAVCAPMGADRRSTLGMEAPRWRSPYRWSRLVDELWPARVLHPTGWRDRVEALLLSFVGMARSLQPEALARCATAVHVPRGAAV